MASASPLLILIGLAYACHAAIDHAIWREMVISSGAYHTCALNLSGSMACWGWDDYNQATAASGPFSAVSAGTMHTCAILNGTDGEAVCYGSNNFKQSEPPLAVDFAQLSAGALHTCGIRKDDATAWCFGSDYKGQSDPPRGVPLAHISSGWEHTCGVRADSFNVTCWGENSEGQAAPGIADTPATVDDNHEHVSLPPKLRSLFYLFLRTLTPPPNAR